MSFHGFLDTNDGWFVEGWAFDDRRPAEPVEVEFELAGRAAGRVLADRFRPDLLKSEIGDGGHAFRFQLPLDIADSAGAQLIARVSGGDFALGGSPMRLSPRVSVGFVAGDLVNNCNLRCPFCVIDYANIHGLKLMTAATFQRAVALLPHMARGTFWLSCLHEPTLHPQLVDLIESVPVPLRDRLSFTTNLCKRLPDATLERLAHAGLDHIRVSFDSREPARFAELRQGGKYEVFAPNLERLAAFMHASPQRSRLHLISMAFRNNYRELPDLVRYGRETLGAESHEVRFPYYGPHLAQWGRDRVLDAAEWQELERSLAPLQSATRLEVFGPEDGVRDRFEHAEGVDGYVSPESPFGGPEGAALPPPPGPADIGRRMPDEPLRLHLRWDGIMQLQQLPEHLFRLNVNQLEQPAMYFEAIRIAAKARLALLCDVPREKPLNLFVIH